MADDTMPQTDAAGNPLPKWKIRYLANRAAYIRRNTEWQIKNRERINAREREKAAPRIAARNAEIATRRAMKAEQKAAAHAAKKAEREANRKAQKKAWAAQWRQKNRSLANAQVKAWYDANPEKKRLIKRVAAARRRNAPGKFTTDDVRELLQAQHHRCAYPFCRASLKAGFNIDHIMPIALGGTNERRNIQLLCAPCNTRKSAKHPLTFAQENGLLL